jgi:hypothetical protein
VELGRRIQEGWDEIPHADIGNLISNMSRRVAECIRNRGGSTHY